MKDTSTKGSNSDKMTPAVLCHRVQSHTFGKWRTKTRKGLLPHPRLNVLSFLTSMRLVYCRSNNTGRTSETLKHSSVHSTVMNINRYGNTVTKWNLSHKDRVRRPPLLKGTLEDPQWRWGYQNGSFDISWDELWSCSDSRQAHTFGCNARWLELQ